MEIIGALIVSTIAGLSTMLGGLVIFFHFKGDNINKFITASLSFSLAIMIGISITDLIPESTFILLNNLGISKGIIYSVIAFLIGVILIRLLNKLIARAEANSSDLYKLGILNMLALILHNFPEGIATFMSSYKDIGLGIKLALAIAFHNIPEGISIAVPIYYATKSKKNALIKTFLSGIAEPIGALIAYIFLSKYITDSLISIILILVGGIMISLAIEVILPKAKDYNLNKWLYLGMVVGVGLILFNYFAF
ncbi:MAG: ZIP family metal transporter [Bacilli bacterium]|nr:ZIP family metal transporter [Bacilli bacterium]